MFREVLERLRPRERSVEDYFKRLKRTAESEEARNKRMTERIRLKKREFDLKQRIAEARTQGKKLEEQYAEYDPKASGRKKWKVYGLITLGMILFYMMLKACTAC